VGSVLLGRLTSTVGELVPFAGALRISFRALAATYSVLPETAIPYGPEFAPASMKCGCGLEPSRLARPTYRVPSVQ
jgi:hypothetical protein